jgi:hypothetical protein
MEEATQVIVAIKKELQLKKWSEEIKSCAESGMKVKDWCEINGLKTKTYYYHLRRVRESMCCAKTVKQSVVPIKTSDTRERNQESTIWMKTSSVSISLPVCVDPELMIRLAKELNRC